MDFWLTDDLNDLQAGMRSFVEGRFDIESIAEREESDTVIDVAKWRELGEMGVFSLQREGFDNRAAVLAFEELGRGLVPGPLVASNLMGEFDEAVAAGTEIVGLIEPAPHSTMVEHADQVDRFLLAQPSRLAIVDKSDLELTTVDRPLDALSPTSRMTNDNVRSHPIQSASPDVAERVHLTGVVLTAAQLLGVALGALDLANAYAKEREQFGRPIGSFQAVKHLLAEMLAKAEVARSAVYAAACALDGASDDEPDRAASVAKIMAGEAALFCGKTGIQVHGGMGFTWEVHAQRYWKRAVVLDSTFGSVDAHAEAVATYLTGAR